VTVEPAKNEVARRGRNPISNHAECFVSVMPDQAQNIRGIGFAFCNVGFGGAE
jgi:hypothetical protein